MLTKYAQYDYLNFRKHELKGGEIMSKKSSYPPIKIGTKVRTTEPNMSMKTEWLPEAWVKRRWGVVGPVINYHDSHGLCYDVQHPDGSVGSYDPSEFCVVNPVPAA